MILVRMSFKERYHCGKIVRIRSFSGPYFPEYGLNMDQKNSEYGHFLLSHRINLLIKQAVPTFTNVDKFFFNPLNAIVALI